MENIIKPKMLEYIIGNKRICNKTKVSAPNIRFKKLLLQRGLF